MKIRLYFILCALLSVIGLMSSCSYDDYADADYPASEIYQSRADGILHIDSSADVSTSETPTKGGPILYSIDKQQQKLIVYMGVVQSGIEFCSGNVQLALNDTIVPKEIADGTIDDAVIALPDNKVSIPNEVRISGVSAPFTAEIDLSTINDPQYAGKQLAFAVTLASSSIKINDKLATQVVIINTDFIKSKL